MLSTLKRLWTLRDLRSRILLTVGLLLIYRILAHIPLPGVDTTQLKNFFANNDIFNLIDLFSGGGLRNFSIVLMGVSPYITSSVVFQLLTMVIPSLEQLQKEGQYGQQKINQYTRWATVPFAVIQAYATLLLLRNQGVLGQWTAIDLVTMLIVAAAGTILLMWIGEIITESGIGNGISMIIAVGILAGLPGQLTNILQLVGIDFSGGQLNTDAFDAARALTVLGFVIFAILAIAAIVYVTEGERQIPVTYARRIRGRAGSTGGVNTHLPIRVTTAGVMPIIFAISLMLFPPLLAKFFAQAHSESLRNIAATTERLFQNNIFYGSVYFILVVAFTYFYTSIVFQPEQVAENLQKQGGFIPGIRPGRETANHIGYILSRITLTGALFLGLIAVLPFLVQSATKTQTLVLGGTGLLIVVSVVIETMRQFRAQMLMHTYDA